MAATTAALADAFELANIGRRPPLGSPVVPTQISPESAVVPECESSQADSGCVFSPPPDDKQPSSSETQEQADGPPNDGDDDFLCKPSNAFTLRKPIRLTRSGRKYVVGDSVKTAALNNASKTKPPSAAPLPPAVQALRQQNRGASASRQFMVSTPVKRSLRRQTPLPPSALTSKFISPIVKANSSANNNNTHIVKPLGGHRAPVRPSKLLLDAALPTGVEQPNETFQALFGKQDSVGATAIPNANSSGRPSAPSTTYNVHSAVPVAALERASRRIRAVPELSGVRPNRTSLLRFRETEERAVLRAARQLSYRTYLLTAKVLQRTPQVELAAGFP